MASELVWSRPYGLLALSLPLLVWLLGRLLDRPPPVATGTFALWQEVARRAPDAAPTRRPRTPLSTWVLVLALLAGALGLAGPRALAPAGARTWTAHLDLAPATGLAWTAEDGPAAPGAPTRLERAVAAARGWLAAEARPEDRVRWTAAGREAWMAPGEGPGAAWIAEARAAAARAGAERRPSPAAFDRPGALLVTDRAPDAEPVAAGWFAAGGAAVHGPIAADSAGLWIWDGETVRHQPFQDGSGARVALDESAALLPASVAGLASTWAGVRGVGLLLGPHAARLVVRAASGALSAEEREAEVGRDGWRALARYPAGGLGAVEEPAGSVWLAAPDGVPLVRARPGRIEVALRELSPRGDPALFAVSWGELLDASFPPHPAVVPLAARVAAGPPSSRAPKTPPEEMDESARTTRFPLDVWLAGAAAALAFVSLAVARRGA